MVRVWLSAVFAVTSSAIFILTVACRGGQIHSDIVICSVLHPVQYFMSALLMLTSFVLLKDKPWF